MCQTLSAHFLTKLSLRLSKPRGLDHYLLTSSETSTEARGLKSFRTAALRLTFPSSAGSSQGCPISGLAFNISIDPVIRSIQRDHVEHKVLAFADDLCLLAASPDELQQILDSVQAQLAALGMKLNPRKSVSLHFSGCTPVGVKNTCFRVGNENISPLKEGEFTKFLGRPVGFNAWPDFNSLNDLSDIGAKILSSALAPWQRLDALKSFFFPALQFPMRTAQFQKTAWQALDSTIRSEIKNTLGLPENAANEYLYGHKSKGSCSIPIAAEESDPSRIDTAFKLLTSSDEEIVHLASEDLRQTIAHRLKIPSPSDADLEEFLSGVTKGPFSTTDNAYSNVWTCARLASRRLGVAWEFDDGVPRVKYNDLVVRASGRRKVIFSIRDRLRNNRSTTLINKPSQGKAMECVAQSPASSHFIADGTYTRFADWRFIHRARLNLLPLNGSQVWKEDKRCRRCNEADLETLPHVLNHWKGKSRGWQLRHDTIVARVKKALATRCTIISENQSVGPNNLHPDLVVQSGNKVYIVDVTIPFENRMEGFEKAKRLKHDKYASLLPLYSSSGMQVSIVPIVVGALGAWDPENDRFLSKYMSRGYLNKFRKLCVSDCIKWSRDIYVEHITGHRQFTDGVDLKEHLTPPEPPSDM
ncbi:Retrovirus-related Pol polyprotein type-2 like protein [Argiope bruennichi]|uniref:Retrovirus-related Pol polyprotein type-2 like protein n=1 Tax=Argiope bruennichi TaxID=94029 RepID=A0A8T0G1H7_ARGBR|nr:Retrovirus-related Pol polyprotein type-2 like protein [Argiope bruennichi]